MAEGGKNMEEKKFNENDIKIIGGRKERGKGGREEGNRKEEKEQTTKVDILKEKTEDIASQNK